MAGETISGSHRTRAVRISGPLIIAGAWLVSQGSFTRNTTLAIAQCSILLPISVLSLARIMHVGKYAGNLDEGGGNIRAYVAFPPTVDQLGTDI